MKNLNQKEDNKIILIKRILDITTISIYTLSMIIYEILFCNSAFLTGIVNNQNDIIYNFSLFRVFVYLLIYILYFIFRKKFIETAINTYKNKAKKYFTIWYCIIALIAILVLICNVSLIPTPRLALYSLTILMSVIVILYISNDYIKNTIIIMLNLGILFSITVDFNHALDEKKHFMSAFNVSEGEFDYNKPVKSVLMDTIPQINNYINSNKFFDTKYEDDITDDVNMGDIPATPTSYNSINYIPSAIGIILAKVLGGSIADVYIAGRIFNLLFYLLLVVIALRILPYKQDSFFVTFTLPIAVCLAATYSIDATCIGLVSIFVAYCLNLYSKNETIKLKQAIILFICFVGLVFAKSAGYIGIALVALILPIYKTLKQNKKYIPYFAIISVILIICIVIGAVYIKNTKLTSDPRGGNTGVEQQINHLITNPKNIIILAYNHILNTFGSFSWLSQLVPATFFRDNSSTIMLYSMLFVLYVALTDASAKLKIKQRIIFIISVIGTFAITSLALYLSFTEVGQTYIAGYQTRYILPILPLIFMTISSNNIEIKNNTNRKMFISTVVVLFMVLSIISAIRII